MPRLAAILRLVSLLGLLHAGLAAAQALEDDPTQHTPPWFKNSFLDLREDVADAASEGKRVMLYFYQHGCPYCARLLEDNFGQQVLADKTQRYFDVIAINMWGDREVTDLQGQAVSEKQFAVDMRVQFTPTLLFLNEQGEVVFRINGYYPPHKFDVALDYVGKKMEGETSFSALLEKLEPEASSGVLHQDAAYLQPPYQLQGRDRRGGKPLLVLFEQRNCSACDELHLDTFKRPETRELLQGYDIALFDTWSRTPLVTPQGKQTTARDWARDLGIQYTPSMVFFDREGREVFRTEGYLWAFHVQTALDYVASGAYRTQPEFQRYLSARADELRARGVEVDITR